MRFSFARYASALAAICAGAFAGIAWAQEADETVPYDPCDQTTAPFERIIGTYKASYSPFRVTFGGMKKYHGDGGEVAVAIDYLGEDAFFLDLSRLNAQIKGAEIPNMDLTITGPDEPDWRFSDDPELSPMTQEDFELTFLGTCGISDVPRFHGFVEGTAGDLSVMHWVRLALIDDGVLFGAYGWDAAEGNLRGRLYLTRQSMETTLD